MAVLGLVLVLVGFCVLGTALIGKVRESLAAAGVEADVRLHRAG